jgi:hypothetical protein
MQFIPVHPLWQPPSQFPVLGLQSEVGDKQCLSEQFSLHWGPYSPLRHTVKSKWTIKKGHGTILLIKTFYQIYIYMPYIHIYMAKSSLKIIGSKGIIHATATLVNLLTILPVCRYCQVKVSVNLDLVDSMIEWVINVAAGIFRPFATIKQ